jgi:hypothetical protein
LGFAQRGASLHPGGFWGEGPPGPFHAAAPLLARARAGGGAAARANGRRGNQLLDRQQPARKDKRHSRRPARTFAAAPRVARLNSVSALDDTGEHRGADIGRAGRPRGRSAGAARGHRCPSHPTIGVVSDHVANFSPLTRLPHSIVSWWRTHRGGVAESVVASLLVVIILAVVAVVLRPSHRGGHARTTATNTTATDISAPSPVTSPLPLGLQRDPPDHRLRTFGPDSSAEFFSDRLVVSVGSISRVSSGEWIADRVVIRSAAGGHCELPNGLAGSAWGLRDEAGHLFRVDLRGLGRGHAGFVAYTSRSTSGDHPGSAECMLLSQSRSRRPQR